MYSNDEVNWFLEELSTSPAQLKLLDLSLGRLLKKAAANAEDWRMLCTNDQANLISEWLTQSIQDDAAWLKSLDDFGRPRKLMKFTTVAQIEKEAAKALQKVARRALTPSVMIAQGQCNT